MRSRSKVTGTEFGNCTKIRNFTFKLIFLGLQYGYINGVFGVISQDYEYILRYGFPCVQLELDRNEPKIEPDPSTTSRISQSPLQEVNKFVFNKICRHNFSRTVS